MTGSAANVYAGIDTHQGTHHVGIVSEVGRKLGDCEFPATRAGYADLLSFVLTFGTVIAIGVEGTASYGAGITAYLRDQGITVKEVIRPNRQVRRGGKSDPIDAYAAAKTVAADGDSLPIPKLLGGAVDGLRMMLKARATAVKARTAAISQIVHFLTTAPAAVREEYTGMKDRDLHAVLAASTPEPDDHLRVALKRLAMRIEFLNEEITTADDQIAALTADVAPALAAAKGIGPISAAKLLVTAGENPNESRRRLLSLPCAGPARYRHHQARPSGTGLTGEETGKPTARCTTSSSAECPSTSAPEPMLHAGGKKGKQPKRSCAASNATSLPRFTPSSSIRQQYQPLTICARYDLHTSCP